MKKSLDEFWNNNFKDFVKESFLKVQNSLNEHDLNTLALIESPLLFEQHARKIQALDLEGKKQVKKDVTFHNINFIEHYIRNEFEKEYEYIKVMMKVSLKHYIYEIATDEVVEGIRDYNDTKIYQLTFKKKKNYKESEKSYTVKCKACNADVNMNALGKCEYCGTISYNENYYWIIDELEEVECIEEFN